MAFGTIAANKSQRVSMVSALLKVGVLREYTLPVIEKTRLHDADVAVNPISMASQWSHIRHFNSYSPYLIDALVNNDSRLSNLPSVERTIVFNCQQGCAARKYFPVR